MTGIRPTSLKSALLLAGLLPALVYAGDTLYCDLSGNRRRANEAGVMQVLRGISAAQVRFRTEDLEGDGVLDYARNLEELHEAGLITDTVARHAVHGYMINVTGEQFEWKCTARPLSRRAGGRNFSICADGVISFDEHRVPGCERPCPKCLSGNG